MRSFLARVFGVRPEGPNPVRDRGRPPSGNGASSLHLLWEASSQPWRAARATLEVATPPRTNDLYFFALQATFATASRHHGGAHVGLQWNRRHPNSTAVNWGGYHSQDLGGQILTGTESALPSLPGDPNTRDYPWQRATPYRLTIEPGSEPGWWLGSIEDLATGSATRIRELHGGGDTLVSPMVWAEVFAPCEAPSVAIRWTDFQLAGFDGDWQNINRARAKYQQYRDGGCTNTTSATDAAGGFVQVTNSRRVNPDGAVLRADQESAD